MAALQHHFDVDIATKFGVTEAILVNNFQYWIAKNIANNKHYYDGRYWTYNSVHAYAKYFPYLTHDKIRRAIDRLVADGVLIKGNYNKDPKDRTLWYALSDKYVPIWHENQDDLANTPDAFGNNAEPIPYSNSSDSNTYENEDNFSRTINSTSKNISSPKKLKKGFDLSFVNIAFEDVFNTWLDYKRSKNQMYKRQIDVEIAYRKLLEYSNNDPKTAQEIIESAILGNYMGFFAPKQFKQQSNGNSTQAQQPINRFVEFAKSIKAAGGII